MFQAIGTILTLWMMGVAPAQAAAQEGPSATMSNAPSPAAQRLAPPPLPPNKPPIDFFRELLAMTPEQRSKVLSSRPPEGQKNIMAKVREYEALSPEQRELRLRVTEMRYYLLPLMSVPTSARGPMLERVPAGLQSMIGQRLTSWDALSPEKRKELLENEAWLRHVADVSAGSPSQQPQVTTNMSAAQRRELEEAVSRWQALSEGRRQELAQRFEEYFGLRPQERTRTLRAFTDLERRQMERTLQAFSHLDPVRRAKCVRALDKLAELTPAEREEFLRNAERWQSLSLAERKAWRDLVFRLSMPPAPQVPFPPLPGAPRTSRPSAGVATNL